MIDNLRDNWQTLVLAIVFAVVVAWGNYSYAKGNQQNICNLVTQSQKADAAQITYYQGLETRATARATADTGTARQADLDAASSARHTKNQYIKAQKFKFPGC